MTSATRYLALVPAAGSGSRVGGPQAKQYLSLAGRPLVSHALQTLCATDCIETVIVVLAESDVEWSRHDWSGFGNKLVPLFCGGDTRAKSVANGLRAVADRIKADDWVLVHDAARPCLTGAQVDALVREVGDDPVGGILALPVADTLKRADSSGQIEATVSREKLWQAQTPQMFRYGMLLRALTQHEGVTDEAAAIETLGYRPKLVAGDANNLKVTWPQDLWLAELILKARKTA